MSDNDNKIYVGEETSFQRVATSILKLKPVKAIVFPLVYMRDVTDRFLLSCADSFASIGFFCCHIALLCVDGPKKNVLMNTAIGGWIVSHIFGGFILPALEMTPAGYRLVRRRDCVGVHKEFRLSVLNKPFGKILLPKSIKEQTDAKPVRIDQDKVHVFTTLMGIAWNLLYASGSLQIGKPMGAWFGLILAAGNALALFNKLYFTKERLMGWFSQATKETTAPVVSRRVDCMKKYSNISAAVLRGFSSVPLALIDLPHFFIAVPRMLVLAGVHRRQHLLDKKKSAALSAKL